MISVTYRDIQSKIAGFLAEQTTFAELQDWVAEIAWDIDSSTAPEISQLIHDTELRIAEYDSGHLPRNNFVDELKEMAIGALDVESDASGNWINLTSDQKSSGTPESNSFIEGITTHATEPFSSYGQEYPAQSQSSYKEYEMEFSS